MYYNNYRNQNFDTRSVAIQLIAINVIVYVACQLFRTSFPYNSPEFFLGLHYPSSIFFKPWQIITHMFMHEGLMHIFFNMFNLYIFGTVLERVWGPKRFLEFYFLTGFGAMLLYTGVQALEVYHMSGSFTPSDVIVNTNEQLSGIINAPVIGASGAIFGLLTAYGVLFANSDLYLYGAVPIKAKYLVGAMILWELYSGFANNPADHVAHFAHLGGALIGYIILKFWNKDRNFLY